MILGGSQGHRSAPSEGAKVLWVPRVLSGYSHGYSRRYGGGFGYAFELDDEPIARVGPAQYDNYSHMEVPEYSEFPSVSTLGTRAGCEYSRGPKRERAFVRAGRHADAADDRGPNQAPRCLERRRSPSVPRVRARACVCWSIRFRIACSLCRIYFVSVFEPLCVGVFAVCVFVFGAVV